MRLISQKMQKPERLKKTVKHKNKTQEVKLSDSELVSCEAAWKQYLSKESSQRVEVLYSWYSLLQWNRPKHLERHLWLLE